MFPKDMVDNLQIKDETQPLNITKILDSISLLIHNFYNQLSLKNSSNINTYFINSTN